MFDFLKYSSKSPADRVLYFKNELCTQCSILPSCLVRGVFCNIMLFFCMGSTDFTEVVSRVWMTLKDNFWTFGTCSGTGNGLELETNCIL